jgi:cellulose biosynthesis protein BcsQ
MAPKHAIAFSNNKGGSGKTFMAFQIACEAARSRPDAKVCVVDFSLYSDISALMLGGSAREGIGAPMRGLQTCVDVTEESNRAEGLVRALELAADARRGNAGGKQDDHDGAGGGAGRRGSVFGTWFARESASMVRHDPSTEVDLTDFMIKPNDVNEAVPENLYLIAGAGTVSWNPETTAMSDGSEQDIPLWARSGDDWVDAGRVFRDAVRNLPGDFDAIFVDTDHLAACVLTKLAFASMDSIVIPLSYNDMDFNRLFADITGNGLFTDVLKSMNESGHLRARVKKMMFTRVGSTANAPTQSPGGISSPFTPTKTSTAQMDDMARQIWSACDQPVYKALFADIDSLEAKDGNAVNSFMREYFGMFKLVPEMASLLSTMNGIPVCTMTSKTYTAANGLSGNTSAAVLNSLKAELSASARDILDERYNAPIAQS